MAPASLTRLLDIAEREFKTNRAAPVKRRFKGMKLDFSKFDTSWEKRRGKAVRLMAVLLRDDDQALYQRVSTDEHAASGDDFIKSVAKDREFAVAVADAHDSLFKYADALKDLLGLVEEAGRRSIIALANRPDMDACFAEAKAVAHG